MIHGAEAGAIRMQICMMARSLCIAAQIAALRRRAGMDIRGIFRQNASTADGKFGNGRLDGAARPAPDLKGRQIPFMVTIQVPKLIDFVADVFTHSESSPEEARRIATYLTTANLTGHDSHGVIRVPVYIRWKKMGSVVPDQKAEVLVDTPSLAVVDGKFGYGQTVAPQAVKIGIEKCKAAGLAAVALRNAGHIGRVGDWAEMAAAEGLVSVHFVNAAGSLLVAPYGGVQKRLSTAPYCVGIPRRGQDPIVLDFAPPIVPDSKGLVASRGGKKLPKGALVERDGTLSEEPSVLYGPHTADGPRDHTKGTGAIRAFGEHKGSGLAFICELLGGALTGTGATAPDRRFANGMLAFYRSEE